MILVIVLDKVWLSCFLLFVKRRIVEYMHQKKKIVHSTSSAGELYIPESNLDMSSVADMFTKIAEKYYGSYKGLLTCGHLKCNVTLYPSPEAYSR